MAARALLAVEARCALLWGPLPLAWLRIGGRIYVATGSLAADGFLGFAGFVASVVIVVAGLRRIDFVWISLRRRGPRTERGCATGGRGDLGRVRNRRIRALVLPLLARLRAAVHAVLRLEPERAAPWWSHAALPHSPQWLLVNWKQATSYWDTALAPPLIADGVPSLPA
jgi:hypothetical protein